MIVALALLAAPAIATAETAPIQRVVYTCDKDQQLDVVYINTASDNFAVLSQMGELVPMKQAVSGSGARYVASNANYTYELTTKGKSATLSDSKGEIATNCNAAN